VGGQRLKRLVGLDDCRTVEQGHLTAKPIPNPHQTPPTWSLKMHHPAPKSRCAWCVPPLHITATPNCAARRAASTADPVPISVRRTRVSDQGSPILRILEGSMEPSRKLLT
jgi:hypothetical protein